MQDSGTARIGLGVKAEGGNVSLIWDVELADGTTQSVSFTLSPEKTQGFALGMIRGALIAQGHMPPFPH
jgi:hypothetical protein